MYVHYSIGTGTGSTTGPQPNNSYAIVDTGRGSQSTRVSVYCCSNSSSSNGRIVLPDGQSTAGWHWYLRVSRSSSSETYGCIQFYYSYSYNDNFYLSSYSGIYTCMFSSNEVASIGLYSQEAICEYQYDCRSCRILTNVLLL